MEKEGSIVDEVLQLEKEFKNKAAEKQNIAKNLADMFSKLAEDKERAWEYAYLHIGRLLEEFDTFVEKTYGIRPKIDFDVAIIIHSLTYPSSTTPFLYIPIYELKKTEANMGNAQELCRQIAEALRNKEWEKIPAQKGTLETLKELLHLLLRK